LDVGRLEEYLMVEPVPAAYAGVMPYLIVRGAARALDFYAEAFGAKEWARFPTADGQIAHAEMRSDDGVFMLADGAPEQGDRSLDTLGGWSVPLSFYVTDVDALFARAIGAGGVVQRPPQDQFYGDRTATIADPFGQTWTIATHLEDVSHEEMQRRMAAMASGGSAG
jgi:PhnB protein